MHTRCDELYIVEPERAPWDCARWGTQAFETRIAADMHVSTVGRSVVSHWRRSGIADWRHGTLPDFILVSRETTPARE